VKVKVRGYEGKGKGKKEIRGECEVRGEYKAESKGKGGGEV
jgi:hypothetical protein